MATPCSPAPSHRGPTRRVRTVRARPLAEHPRRSAGRDLCSRGRSSCSHTHSRTSCTGRDFRSSGGCPHPSGRTPSRIPNRPGKGWGGQTRLGAPLEGARPDPRCPLLTSRTAGNRPGKPRGALGVPRVSHGRAVSPFTVPSCQGMAGRGRPDRPVAGTSPTVRIDWPPAARNARKVVRSTLADTDNRPPVCRWLPRSHPHGCRNPGFQPGHVQCHHPHPPQGRQYSHSSRR